ncbi:uncharacterized protein PG986_013244 [Apiospora aurea]|uniref:Uncharacterized protein n=1 Tax=Apiospora aurea TaxID=335848 RepID=A0ABR1PV07_9PEZI
MLLESRPKTQTAFPVLRDVVVSHGSGSFIGWIAPQMAGFTGLAGLGKARGMATGAEQSKAEQSRAEQSRAEQSRAERLTSLTLLY